MRAQEEGFALKAAALTAPALMAPVLVAVLAVALAGAVQLVKPTVPEVQDEFSYLLAADTFASGRLTNRPHPLRRHFNAAHVLQMPSYQSKYQPAQGLALALGQVTTGSPLMGVWLSFALACAAVCWMLQAWLPTRWALLGGVLAATSGPWLRAWSATYMGGATAMLGGALLYGALARGLRDPRRRWGVLVGAGLVVLALSRPFEGLVSSLPAAVVLLVALLRPGNRPRRSIVQGLVVPISIVLLLGAVWLGYYNFRVTGNALELPYQTYLEQHGSDVFSHPKASQLSERRMTRISSPLAARLARQAEAHIGHQWVFALPILLATPGLLRRRWGRITLAATLLTLVAASLTFGSLAHYSAPAAALIVGLLAHSLSILYQTPRSKRVGALLVAGFVAAWWLNSVTVLKAAVDDARFAVQTSRRAAPPAEPVPLLEDDSRLDEILYWRWYMTLGMTARQTHLDRLEGEGGRHVVLVRYLDGSTRHREWVYNRADIDASAVVWVRWTPNEPLWPIVAYYPDRQFWLVEPEVDPWTLHPFATDSVPRWHLRQHSGARARMEASEDPRGPVMVEIGEAGENIWQLQIERPHPRIEEGKAYRGSFTASASTQRHIRVRISQGHPPWRDLGFLRSYSIDEERRTFPFRFTARRTEPIPRLVFELGLFDADVEISNVHVEAVPQ